MKEHGPIVGRAPWSYCMYYIRRMVTKRYKPVYLVHHMRDFSALEVCTSPDRHEGLALERELIQGL